MFGIFRKNRRSELREELKLVLQEVYEYVKQSEDSIWSDMDTKEIKNKLLSADSVLSKGKSPSTFSLKYLFAPTGPLQETAIENDWVEEYMVLAEKFDKVMDKWG